LLAENRLARKQHYPYLPEKNVNILLPGFCFLTLNLSPLEAVSAPDGGVSAPVSASFENNKPNGCGLNCGEKHACNS
jgi:hypothetical protein